MTHTHAHTLTSLLLTYHRQPIHSHFPSLLPSIPFATWLQGNLVTFVIGSRRELFLPAVMQEQIFQLFLLHQETDLDRVFFLVNYLSVS